MLLLSLYPADENLRFFDRAVVVPSEGNGIIIRHEIIRTQGACSRALAFFVGIGFLREMRNVIIPGISAVYDSRYMRVMEIERESSGVRYDTDEWKINRYSYIHSGRFSTFYEIQSRYQVPGTIRLYSSFYCCIYTSATAV